MCYYTNQAMKGYKNGLTRDLDNLVHSYEYIYNKRNIEDYRLFSMTDLADEIDMSEDNVKIMLSKLKQYNIIEWHNNLPTKINIEAKPTKTQINLNTKKNTTTTKYVNYYNSTPKKHTQNYRHYKGKIKSDFGEKKTQAVELIIPIEVEDINLTLKLKIEYENYFERKNQKIEPSRIRYQRV